MKKTIAILLVLVLAGVGLFATTGAETNASNTIVLTTSVAAESYFGVSEGVIEASSFLSTAAFVADENVVSTITVASQPMSNFKATAEAANGPIVGYLSGINNTTAKVYLGIGIGSFASSTLTGETPIALTVTPDTTTARQEIPAASTILGTLKNVPIRVRETTAGSIDLAPAAEDYSATITVTVVAS